MKSNSSWTAKHRNKKGDFQNEKIASIFMVFTLLLSLAACSSNTNNTGTSSASQSSQPNSSQTVGSDDSSTDSESSAPESEATQTGSKSLVVYFSWSGNTENVAKSIQSQTDSDILKSYPPRRTATIMMLLWIWRRQNKAKTPGLRLQTALKILRTMM